MPQVTNLTQIVIDFVVKGEPKDGVPPTESVQPGETKNVDFLDEQAGEVAGRVAVGAIRIGGDVRRSRQKE